MDIENLHMSSYVDDHGHLEMEIIDDDYNMIQIINRDEAIKIVEHLCNVFELDIALKKLGKL